MAVVQTRSSSTYLHRELGVQHHLRSAYVHKKFGVQHHLSSIASQAKLRTSRNLVAQIPVRGRDRRLQKHAQRAHLPIYTKILEYNTIRGFVWFLTAHTHMHGKHNAGPHGDLETEA